MSCTVEIKTAQSGRELRNATSSGEEASDPDKRSPTPPLRAWLLAWEMSMQCHWHISSSSLVQQWVQTVSLAKNCSLCCKHLHILVLCHLLQTQCPYPEEPQCSSSSHLQMKHWWRFLLACWHLLAQSPVSLILLPVLYL